MKKFLLSALVLFSLVGVADACGGSSGRLLGRLRARESSGSVQVRTTSTSSVRQSVTVRGGREGRRPLLLFRR